MEGGNLSLSLAKKWQVQPVCQDSLLPLSSFVLQAGPAFLWGVPSEGAVGVDCTAVLLLLVSFPWVWGPAQSHSLPSPSPGQPAVEPWGRRQSHD